MSSFGVYELSVLITPFTIYNFSFHTGTRIPLSLLHPHYPISYLIIITL